MATSLSNTPLTCHPLQRCPQEGCDVSIKVMADVFRMLQYDRAPLHLTHPLLLLRVVCGEQSVVSEAGGHHRKALRDLLLHSVRPEGVFKVAQLVHNRTILCRCGGEGHTTDHPPLLPCRERGLPPMLLCPLAPLPPLA